MGPFVMIMKWNYKIPSFYEQFRASIIKKMSYSYRNPHYKLKTVWRPSQVHNGNPYTNKTVSLWLELEALDITTVKSLI